MEERFCANCGSRPESGSCCWYVDGETEALKPHPSIGAKAWEAWNADQRFLIALLMEQFGGAAEEWELLRRLPWTCSRLSNCTCDPWGAWAVPAGQYPCMRAREEEGTRLFLTDLARHSYAARVWQELGGATPQGQASVGLSPALHDGEGRYCSSCGRRPVGECCCWYIGPGGRTAPCELMPAISWEVWDEDERFLITLLMVRFGGAAVEWDLLRRLPWTRLRLLNYVCDTDDRPEGAGELYPCFRERDHRGRGYRIFVSDVARASYAACSEVSAVGAAFEGGWRGSSGEDCRRATAPVAKG